MDTILLTVTGVSLTLASVMGVLLVRMLRDERRRSDARVALLSELAADPAGTSLVHDMQAAQRPRRHDDFVDEQALQPQRRLIPTAEHEIEPPQPRPVVRRSPSRPVQQPPAPEPIQTKPARFLVLEDEDDFELRPAAASEVSGAHELFHEPQRSSAWPRRLAAVGGLATVVLAVVFGWSSLRFHRSSEPAPTDTVSEVVVDPPSRGALRRDLAGALAEAGAPLELLSLRHSLEDGGFTITGLVQNPRSGRTLSGVKATVFVFGPGGAFLASGRAGLDFVSLGPGDESPFVIKVPVKGAVARYRVGFRGEDDRVLSHVDRRSADAIAQK